MSSPPDPETAVSPDQAASPDQAPLEDLLVTERELWPDGPPYELFKRLRSECPVHWTARITEYPEEAGYWSVTTADDVHEVSHDWETYSSERGGVTALTNAIMPLELQQAMFIGMDPPKHDRLKMLFQRGFTPRRIAEHEDAIRAITVGVLDGLAGRETCDLVTDVAQPVVSRVIGSFMGIPPEDDEIWARLMNTTLGAGDPDLNPEGVQSVMERDVPEIFERCRALIAERRERPTDDLTSVLVHAEVDGERLEEHEIVMGFFLLLAAGNDSTKATYSSAMRALMEHPEERQLLLDDPSLVPSAVEESLRMFPAFAHFRRTATRDTELHGQPIREGEKVVDVVRVVEPRRVPLRGPRPLRRHPQPRPPGLRSRRAALLPGRRAGAARAANPPRGDAGALPGDGAGGQAPSTPSRRSSTSSRRCRSGCVRSAIEQRPAGALAPPREELDQQLPDPLGLVVLHPVRGFGQALDALQVGDVGGVGLGQLGADVSIALAPDDQRRGLDLTGPRPCRGAPGERPPGSS